MNPQHWSTHVKHIVIAAGALAVCFFCVRAYVDGEVKKAEVIASSAENIKANEAKAADAQKTITQATASNTQIDADTKRKMDGIQAQLASKPDSEQIQQMITAAVSGLKGLQQTKAPDGTALLSIPDTQENRDAINETDASFKACRFNLDDCQQKQQNFLNIIAAKDQQISAKDDTIKTLTGENKRLSSWGKGGAWWARTGRVALPIGCAVAGAYLGGSRGTKAAAVGAGAAGAVCAFSFHF